MTKLETQLSRSWIANLCKEATNRSERIKFLKIHGEEMQEPGISDYLVCWHGKFIAIEFKVFPNEPKRNQIDFLVDIIECNGIAMVVTFIPKDHEKIKDWRIINSHGIYRDVYKEGQEFTAMLRAEAYGKSYEYVFTY